MSRLPLRAKSRVLVSPFLMPAGGLIWLVMLALAGVASSVAATRRGLPPVRAKLHGLAGLAAAVLVVSLASETPARSASMMASGVALFPASLTFGSQTINTTTPPQTVFVTNIGADTLNLGSVTASGDFAEVTSCGTTLASGASCQVSVTFTPTAIGSRTGTLGFTDDAPGSPQQLNLTGTGLAAPSTSGGTPTGTYNIAVTATSGTLSHFASLTLTVQ
jgi:hypothetical protein